MHCPIIEVESASSTVAKRASMDANDIFAAMNGYADYVDRADGKWSLMELYDTLMDEQLKDVISPIDKTRGLFRVGTADRLWQWKREKLTKKLGDAAHDAADICTLIEPRGGIYICMTGQVQSLENWLLTTDSGIYRMVQVFDYHC